MDKSKRTRQKDGDKDLIKKAQNGEWEPVQNQVLSNSKTNSTPYCLLARIADKRGELDDFLDNPDLKRSNIIKDAVIKRDQKVFSRVLNTKHTAFALDCLMNAVDVREDQGQEVDIKLMRQLARQISQVDPDIVNSYFEHGQQGRNALFSFAKKRPPASCRT